MSSTLEDIRTYIKKSDPSGLSEALLRLASERTSWRQVILREKLGLSPNNQKPVDLPTVSKAIDIVLEQHSSKGDVAWFLEFVRSAQAILNEIASARDKNCAQFWERTPATQRYHLALMLENVLVAAELGNLWGRTDDLHKMIETNTDSERGTPPKSVQDNVEALVTNAQLNLSFISYKLGNGDPGVVDPEPSPFMDPQVEGVLQYAGMRQEVLALISSVKNGELVPRVAKGLDDEDMIFLEPASSGLYAISRMGRKRWEMDLLRFARELYVKSAGEVEEVRRLAASAGATLKTPPAGSLWDGTVDFTKLQAIASAEPYRRMLQETIEADHLEELVRGLRLKFAGGDVGYPDVVEAIVSLQALARAIVGRRNPYSISATPLRYCQERVLLAERARLIELVCRVSALDQATAGAAIDVLTYGKGHKGLDLWARPLIEIRPDVLVIVPAQLLTANPRGVVEEYVSAEGGTRFADRGTPFEMTILKRLRPLCGDRVVQGAKVPYGDSSSEIEKECDILMHWSGWVWVIEAKCLKTVDGADSRYSALKQIAKALDQAQRRKAALLQHWAAVRELAPELQLPKRRCRAKHIVCVAMTNLMDFTPIVYDNRTLVTDFRCFFGFFDTLMSDAEPGASANVGRAVANKKSGRHGVDLLRYLRNPPQVESLKAGFSIGWSRLPRAQGVKSVVFPADQFKGA